MKGIVQGEPVSLCVFGITLFYSIIKWKSPWQHKYVSINIFPGKVVEISIPFRKHPPRYCNKLWKYLYIALLKLAIYFQ